MPEQKVERRDSASLPVRSGDVEGPEGAMRVPELCQQRFGSLQAGGDSPAGSFEQPFQRLLIGV
jgi:hypothetical protein